MPSVRKHFEVILAFLRQKRPVPDAPVEALVRAGYTPVEVRENLKPVAKGQRLLPRKKKTGEPISCRTGKTGFSLCIYKGTIFELDSEGNRYTVMCEEHSTLVYVETLVDARLTDVDDFCDDCRELLT